MSVQLVCDHCTATGPDDRLYLRAVDRARQEGWIVVGLRHWCPNCEHWAWPNPESGDDETPAALG